MGNCVFLTCNEECICWTGEKEKFRSFTQIERIVSRIISGVEPGHGPTRSREDSRQSQVRSTQFQKMSGRFEGCGSEPGQVQMCAGEDFV